MCVCKKKFQAIYLSCLLWQVPNNSILKLNWLAEALYLQENYLRLYNKTSYKPKERGVKFGNTQETTNWELEKSFAYRGAKNWNSLPAQVKAAKSLNSFKKSLETSNSFSANNFIDL